ncbi:MAG: hypothetical protein NT049_15485, partial [Planctomycetota bacterium]|nr:hypothetical protein [Planctomycetota bacterium]
MNRPALSAPAYLNTTPKPLLRLRGVGTLLAILAATTFLAGAAAGEPAWPGSREGLVLVWRNSNRPAEVVDLQTGASRIFHVDAHSTARFGRFFEMDPRGGFFAAEGVQDAVAA